MHFFGLFVEFFEVGWLIVTTATTLLLLLLSVHPSFLSLSSSLSFPCHCCNSYCYHCYCCHWYCFCCCYCHGCYFHCHSLTVFVTPVSLTSPPLLFSSQAPSARVSILHFEFVPFHTGQSYEKGQRPGPNPPGNPNAGPKPKAPPPPAPAPAPAPGTMPGSAAAPGGGGGLRILSSCARRDCKVFVS